MAVGLGLLVGLSAGACGDVEPLPALPQALVVVDTNLPVPLAVSRLRVDLYREDGTWFDSTDINRDDPSAWPVSFGIYADEGQRRGVWVRVRGYPQGFSAAYEGERFRDWDDPIGGPRGDGSPRLMIDGADRTPFAEPAPLLTVDRLAFVRIEPGQQGRVQLLLHGACIGTMAKLGPDGRPAMAVSESCIDQEKKRQPVQPTALEASMERPTTSAVGTWLSEPCSNDDENSSTVCVPGGATRLGTVEDSDYLPSTQQLALAVRPVRTLGIHRFYIDRNEMSVGRVRAAIAAGYTGARPTTHDGPLNGRYSATGDPDAECTYTHEAGDREDYPVTCISWSGARALCQFLGGELPTELQWEHAATVAGQQTKQRFPWGNALPTCDRAVYDRDRYKNALGECAHLPAGPRPLRENADDRTPLGILGLFGNTPEWVLDGPEPYTSDCWLKGALVAPACPPPGSEDSYMARGAGYSGFGIRPTMRLPQPRYERLGLRCVYAKRPR